MVFPGKGNLGAQRGQEVPGSLSTFRKELVPFSDRELLESMARSLGSSDGVCLQTGDEEETLTTRPK
jgi:hypothetical protein